MAIEEFKKFRYWNYTCVRNCYEDKRTLTL